MYIYSISQKWVHPSHFCKYLIISFHVTTLKKWHFATIKCSAFSFVFLYYYCQRHCTCMLHKVLKCKAMYRLVNGIPKKGWFIWKLVGITVQQHLTSRFLRRMSRKCFWKQFVAISAEMPCFTFRSFAIQVFIVWFLYIVKFYHCNPKDVC